MKAWQWVCICLFLAVGAYYFFKSSNEQSHAPANEHNAIINGAGATFPYPLYTKWFAEYHQLNADVKINYQSVGSGGGVRLLIGQKIDFAASDIPMTDEQLSQAHVPVLHVPVALGAIVIVYNLPGVDKGLKLSSDLIADIFLGKIVSWNDPRIVSLNSTLNLPNMPILIAHRSDGSGTTAIFSSYLAKLSPDWQKQVGTGTAVNWPIGLGGKGNEGVAGLVKQNPGSIGYVELIYAEQNKLSFASIKNKAGEFVEPSTAAVTASMKGVVIPEDLRASVVDPDGKDAYPICGLTYLLVFETMPGMKGQKFTNFLRWAISDGQKYIEPLKYAPLPPEFLKKVGDKISKIKS